MLVYESQYMEHFRRGSLWWAIHHQLRFRSYLAHIMNVAPAYAVLNMSTLGQGRSNRFSLLEKTMVKLGKTSFSQLGKTSLVQPYSRLNG